MGFKLVVDSCCDLTQEMVEKMNATIVPLTIELDGERYIDDDTFNVEKYVELMKNSPSLPLTSCPSPNDYMEQFKGDEENIFVVTLSGELSGSYNSAVLGKEMFLEENKHKNIHIFNSCSATSGEVLIAIRLDELIKEGKDFNTIVDIMTKEVEEMQTLFILERLDNLKKAGRLSLVQELLVNALNIKLILGSTKEGNIKAFKKARGTKALTKMVELIGEAGEVNPNKILVISHCLAYDRALQVKEKAQEMYNFRDIIIVPTRGISTNYANEGGVVIAY